MADRICRDCRWRRKPGDQDYCRVTRDLVTGEHYDLTCFFMRYGDSERAGPCGKDGALFEPIEAQRTSSWQPALTYVEDGRTRVSSWQPAMTYAEDPA